MRNGVVIAVGMLMLGLLPAARAQDGDSAEALAVVRSGERATLDGDSISHVGNALRRFEVAIIWDSSSGARPPDHRARVVRYLADCDASTLTLVAVGLFDANGQVLKSLIVPPGAADPVKAAAESREEKWLREVCRR